MKKLIAVLVAVGVLVLMALPAAGAWNAEDVAEVKKKLQEGKGIAEGGSLDSDQVQIVGFSIEAGTTYWIDLKAQLCMLLSRKALAHVPCSAIKKGYPLFAPLITWEN